MQPVEKALLVINMQAKDASRYRREAEDFLNEINIKTTTHVFMSEIPKDVARECDVIISFGGDGTVLYAASIASPLGIPLFPVNLGNLGFIAEIRKNEWKRSFIDWLEGRLDISERLMLSISVERAGAVVERAVCLNDGVITGTGIAKIISLSISMSGTELLRYRADGIIVATPTGSTAYSLASGGPIVAPNLDAIIVTPICPFTVSNRPLVLPAKEQICVFVEENQRTDVILSVDGRISVPLEGLDIVRFDPAPYRTLLVGAGRERFYNVLRSKLNWSGGPDA